MKEGVEGSLKSFGISMSGLIGTVTLVVCTEPSLNSQ